MRGAILLSVVALFCGLATVSEAITCTTEDTCTASNFMKATCTAGNCECQSSYTAGPYGCQKKQTAVITADFTKDVEVGATATLTCSAGEGPYKWFKDAAEDTTEIGRVLTIDTNTAVVNVSYACQAKIAGIQSDTSAAFDFQILSNADAIQIKPNVIGMKLKMVEGTKIKFTCFTEVKYANQVYAWTLDGNTLGIKSDTYVHTVEEAKDDEKTLKCSAATGADSDPVTFPAAGEYQNDIDGVKISNAGPITLQAGQSMDLECQQTGNLPEPDTSDSLIKFKWQKEGKDIPEEEKRTLSITSATAEAAKKYTCTAAAGANSIKTSAQVEVTFLDSLATKAIKPSAKVLYKEKYFSLTCEHDNKNAQKVTYKWLKDDVELPGVTDNILQVNPGTTDFNGDYRCQVSGGSEGASTSSAFKVKLEDPVSVKIKVNNVVVTELKPVTGTKVTMLCHVTKPAGAGTATFKWMNGGTAVPSETSENYEITAGAIVKITCEATVDSETTTSAAVTVTPQADGKSCTTKTDCDEPNMDTTVCNNKKCSCLPSFKWDGKQCSGAAAVMGSLLMIVCVIFAHRIF